MLEYKQAQNKEIDEFVRRHMGDDLIAIAFKWYATNGSIAQLLSPQVKEPDIIEMTGAEYRYATNITVDGDLLSFDVALLCSFEARKNANGHELCHKSKQWLTISFSALLGTKNMVLLADAVKSGSPKRKKQQGNAVDGNLVPYISKDNLDSEAERFLKEYCPEALHNPMPIPILDIITNKMDLNVRLGGVLTDGHNVFGQICLSDMTIRQVCFQSGDIFENNAPRGTVVVDIRTYNRSGGCVNNTLAHEAFHWHRHRVYGTIRDLLHGEQYIACRRKKGKPLQRSRQAPKQQWTDESRIEWQANSIAPRILMPAKTFKVKIDELYEQYGYASVSNIAERNSILMSVISDLAGFFEVSKQSAKIRMLDLGYAEASAVYNYDESKKRRTDTITEITQAEAFREYCENIEFRIALDGGKFRYIDGRFVIDHDNYVKPDGNGGYALTEYARANISECALQFAKYKERPAVDGAKRAGVAYRVDNSTLTESTKYEDEASSSIIDNAEALLTLRKDFDATYSNHAATTPSFAETAKTLMQQKKWNSVIFKEKTHLDDSMYSRLINNKERQPSFYSAVAICVGLGVDAITANKMLAAAGHSFGQSREQQAYCFLFSALRGKSIDECNAFLESLALKTLGNQERKPAEVKNTP